MIVQANPRAPSDALTPGSVVRVEGSEGFFLVCRDSGHLFLADLETGRVDSLPADSLRLTRVLAVVRIEG